MAESANARKETAKGEYAEVCANFRHYSSLRFGIWAVYFGTLILLAALLVNSPGMHPMMLVFLKIFGLLTTAVFWRYQEAMMAHLTYYSNRAKELEAILGYKNLSMRPTPKPWFMRVDLATQLLYGFLVLFWISTFFFS